MPYTLADYMHHCEQFENEQVAWHDALAHFKTDREREAYKAGLRAGMRQAKSLVKLHGNFEFATK